MLNSLDNSINQQQTCIQRMIPMHAQLQIHTHRCTYTYTKPSQEYMDSWPHHGKHPESVIGLLSSFLNLHAQSTPPHRHHASHSHTFLSILYRSKNSKQLKTPNNPYPYAELHLYMQASLLTHTLNTPTPFQKRHINTHTV